MTPGRSWAARRMAGQCLMAEALAEARADFAAKLAEERARQWLADPVQLYALVTQYEVDIWAELANILNSPPSEHAMHIAMLRTKLVSLARKVAEPNAEREARSTITWRGRYSGAARCVVNRRDEE